MLHLAAQTSVDKSFQDPVSCCEHNVMGTSVLLEACRRSPHVATFLYFSTDEVAPPAASRSPRLSTDRFRRRRRRRQVYGETPSGRRSEADALRPTNPYSASKAAAEQLARAYGRICAGRVAVLVTRCCNIYGPRQFPEKAVPRFALRARRGLPCCVHGDGRAVRTFVHVDDVRPRSPPTPPTAPPMRAPAQRAWRMCGARPAILSSRPAPRPAEG